ncbi:MAG TPA: redoxin domain-containing protein [Bacteroidales bacterium]|nr:redoxin domain-containing protein [Bacteroidales bacterium]
MRKLFLVLSLVGFTSVVFSQSKPSKVPVLNFNQLEPYLHRQTDTLYFINFWATWCVPCREELPAIEAIGEKYKNDKLKIYLVSLDFPKQLESRLIPFIRTNKIKSDVILLNDPDQNRWIDKVDASWSGEIPFTVIYDRTSRKSYAKAFTLQELESIINIKLNKP